MHFSSLYFRVYYIPFFSKNSLFLLPQIMLGDVAHGKSLGFKESGTNSRCALIMVCGVITEYYDCATYILK